MNHSYNDQDNFSAAMEQPYEQDPDCSEVQSLHQLLALPSSSWMDTSSQPLKSICLCKTSTIPAGSTQPIIITHCLTVNADLTWSLYVHNHQVKQESCPALQSIPQTLNSESLRNLLQVLEHLHVCCGQPDSHFVSMVTAKKGKIFSSDGKVAASIDQYAPVTLNGEYCQVTVRTGSCELISNSQKCSSCKSYRDTLRAMYNRWRKRCMCEMSDSSSHSNERYLNTPEKKAKMTKLKERAHAAEKQAHRLRIRVD